MWVVEAQKPGINVGKSDCSQNTQDGMGWEYPGYNELPLRLTALLAILTSSEASWEREQRLFSWQGKQYQWRTWTWQALRGRQGNGLPLSSWKWHDPAPLVVGIIDRVWTIKNHLEIWWWWQIIIAIRNSHDGGSLGDQWPRLHCDHHDHYQRHRHHRDRNSNDNDGRSWGTNGHRSRWHFLAAASSSRAPVQILPVIFQITPRSSLLLIYTTLFFFALLSFRFSSSSPSLKYCHFIPISFDWTIGSSFTRLSHITLSLSHLLSHSHLPFMSHCTISSPLYL